LKIAILSQTPIPDFPDFPFSAFGCKTLAVRTLLQWDLYLLEGVWVFEGSGFRGRVFVEVGAVGGGEQLGRVVCD
jgi:hypothetical protein